MATLLRALTISASVASVRSSAYVGRVHSVFRRVVNVVAGDQLLTIADAALGQLPNGVSVQMQPGFSLLDIGLRPDLDIRGDGFRLKAAACDLVIDLTAAATVASRRSIAGPPLPPHAWPARLGLAQELGAALAPRTGLGLLWPHVAALLSGDTAHLVGRLTDPLCRATLPPTATLLTALRAGDAPGVAASAACLAGLGYGLTPSGDDLLTGLAGALALLDEPSTLLDEMVQAARHRTNIIAYTYLDAAARGEVSEVLFRYIRALVAGTHSEVATATQGLFAVGGTSGAELALGALLGAWIVLVPLPIANGRLANCKTELKAGGVAHVIPAIAGG
jgi:hypothetical protein